MIRLCLKTAGMDSSTPMTPFRANHGCNMFFHLMEKINYSSSTIDLFSIYIHLFYMTRRGAVITQALNAGKRWKRQHKSDVFFMFLHPIL